MIFLKLLSWLPLGVLYLLSDVLYVIIYHVWGFRRELSLSNLRNSFPEKSAGEIERIARESYRNACNLIAEVLKGATMGADELCRRVNIRNIDVVEKISQSGKPVVLLASHHCNWEWLLLVLCLRLRISVDAVYKPLRVKAVDGFMREMRARFGGNPIPVAEFLTEVFRRRGTARIFALVADQTDRKSVV